MTYNHFKQLNKIRKEDGLVAALEFDVVRTLKRHPRLIGLYVASAIALSEHKSVEPHVYVDHVEKQDGNNLVRIQGRYPASIAFGNGWISEDVYDYVMGRAK